MDLSDAMAVVAEIVRRGSEKSTKLWCPHKPWPRQAAFLALTCLESLYGGAAGGGKSDALLMAALQHVDVPGYAALILRQSFTDLALPGAVMERSHEWLDGTAANWNGSDHRWTFPSGATLSFGYLAGEHDRKRYKSAEFQYIGWDELTEFPESSYTWMFSRLRKRQGVDVPLRSRGATNPGGVGHDWVKRRFVEEATRGDRVFVPATLEDNPSVDRESYERSLAELDAVTQRQLRDGEWIRDGQGLVYSYNHDRNWREFRPQCAHGTSPAVPCELCFRQPTAYAWINLLGIDLGASQANPTTAMGVTSFAPTCPDVYAAHCEKHAGMGPSDIAERAIKMREDWGGFEQIIVDQGGLGGAYIIEFNRRHQLGAQGAEKAGKLGFRKLMNGDLERGTYLVVGPQCEPLVDEFNSLPWNADGTDAEPGFADHGTDQALYAYRAARHYRAKSKPPPPPLGTEEHANHVAAQAKATRVRRIQEQKRLPWHARRTR